MIPLAQNIGNGVGQLANGMVTAISAPIDFTLQTAGRAIMYTANTTGRVVTKVAAGATVVVGYPLAFASGVVAVASGTFALGPCTAYANLPVISTLSGLAEIVFAPTATSVKIVDAALCPASLSTFVGSATLAFVSYKVAQRARQAFA